jgi:hypothetical protein
MKRSIHLVMSISVFFIALIITDAMANQCSEAVIKAMKDVGLSASQIKSICSKAESYAHKKSLVFTPEKIEQDLIGESVGPDSVVKVKTNSGNRSETGGRSSSESSGNRSYSAFVTVPMGIIFDETNISNINILDTKIKGDKAQVVVHVDTVSNYAGRLRLHYEFIAGEWILRQIENLNFKPQ